MAKRATRKAAKSDQSDVKVMELVQKSGILNKSATLDQIMALSMTLAESGLGDGGIAGRWWFISRYFVLTGTQTK
jgi:hypothetical protein